MIQLVAAIPFGALACAMLAVEHYTLQPVLGRCAAYVMGVATLLTGVSMWLVTMALIGLAPDALTTLCAIWLIAGMGGATVIGLYYFDAARNARERQVMNLGAATHGTNTPSATHGAN